MSFLRWLDSWNSKPDSLEATGLVAFFAGLAVGAVVASQVASHDIRWFAELCLSQFK